MEFSHSYQDLTAWQKAHQFVVAVYRTTKGFPSEEQFGLTSQFRRAAVSIAANIAEGYKKLSKADKLRFFNIAQGSLEECRYYILLSHDIEYIDAARQNELNELVEDTSRLFNAYCKAITDNKIAELDKQQDIRL